MTTAPALRLDYPSSSFRNTYRVRVREYAPGIMECTWGVLPKEGVERGGLPGRKRTEHEKRLDNERRARSVVRRKVLTLGADHLVTLTYRECQVDRDLACRHLRLFVNRMRNALGAWPYVAVMERQERGAIHWHLAVVGRQNIPLLREHWYAVTGGRGYRRLDKPAGQIDVKGPSGRYRFLSERPRIASYLAKYIGKDLAVRTGREKRYFCSKGIEVPDSGELVTKVPISASILILEEFAGKVGYICENGAGGFAASWDLRGAGTARKGTSHVRDHGAPGKRP